MVASLGAPLKRRRAGRICHSDALHRRKVAHRNISRSRRAQSPCGAAGALTVLTFRYCSAQIFLFGTEFAKAIADERAPANTQGREERFTKA